MIGKAYNNIDFLRKALDGTWLRNEAISNNIANVNTPGYKRITVEFESILKDEMGDGLSLKVTDDKHISFNGGTNGFTPNIIEHSNSSTRRDGNNVNIDVETADLAKNTIMYDALTRQVTSEFIKIKRVIEEGGK